MKVTYSIQFTFLQKAAVEGSDISPIAQSSKLSHAVLKIGMDFHSLLHISFDKRNQQYPGAPSLTGTFKTGDIAV